MQGPTPSPVSDPRPVPDQLVGLVVAPQDMFTGRLIKQTSMFIGGLSCITTNGPNVLGGMLRVDEDFPLIEY